VRSVALGEVGLGCHQCRATAIQQGCVDGAGLWQGMSKTVELTTCTSKLSTYALREIGQVSSLAAGSTGSNPGPIVSAGPRRQTDNQLVLRKSETWPVTEELFCLQELSQYTWQSRTTLKRGGVEALERDGGEGLGVAAGKME
jgi:hypothetical protein